jgi:hypothetical protein
MESTPIKRTEIPHLDFQGTSSSPYFNSQRGGSTAELSNGKKVDGIVHSPLIGGSYSISTKTALSINDILSRTTTGHNSKFQGLTRESRMQLGGVEYRAIRLFSYVVPSYFILWQVLGCLGTSLYIGFQKGEATALNNTNPWLEIKSYFKPYVLTFIGG